MYDQGRMWADGLGVEADPDTAQEWYRKEKRRTCSTGSRGSAEEKLLIGSYKGAFPHIGEACFQAEAEKTVVIIIRHFKKPVSLKG